MDQRKEQVLREAKRLEDDIIDLSRRVYENPELSYEEVLASRWCAEMLADHGFSVDWIKGLETAFVATLANPESGPTVGFLAEYDALPDIGHGCGHNLIAGAALGAGLLISKVMSKVPGKIKVFGCPAEENGEGKVAMLERGAFMDTNVALAFHAWHTTAIMTQSTGIRSFDFTFHGKAAHAATDPWAGISALDGVLLTYQNLNALRQFIPDGTRMHGIVTEGGSAHNVIPERASCQISVRATDPAELEHLVERVKDCAEAASIASRARLEIGIRQSLDPIRHNIPLAELHIGSLQALGETVGEWSALASTDFGNISWHLPSILFSVESWSKSVAFHSKEAAVAAGQQKAYEAMMIAAVSMAFTAIDLLSQPEVLHRVEKNHQEGS
jgi:amidohydrolase